VADILEKICADKRDHVARCKAARPLAAVEEAARATAAPLGFARALEAGAAGAGWGLIAEIKRASPSAGEIRPDFDPASLARAYRSGGASCLSVLTDEPYFKGRDAYVLAAKSACGLPCLRKDFMVDPYQVVEARAIGADCILVIMAAVDDGLARELVATARQWNLDVLVEVHDGAELDRALKLDTRLLGINNRNLKTLAVDLATTEQLAPRVPAGRIVVCESGIKQHGDLQRMAASNVRCFLVGEHLMRQQDVAAATRQLLGMAQGVAAVAP
jgi:indole-3-glycerol phosphate synthase